MKDDKRKILMLVRTSGLEYDDRVRKEALSLIQLGYSVNVIANYTDNKFEEGITSYGVPFRAIKLYTRSVFPSARFLPLKMAEFFVRVFFSCLFKKYEYVWAHEEYMALNILLKPACGRYIFDQHELPAFLTKNDIMKKMYAAIESRSHKVIVANQDRLDFMKDSGLLGNMEKYHVLNNFPDKIFSEVPVKELSQEASEFLAGSEFILMQGGGHQDRYPIEVLTAVMKQGEFKLILIGPVDKAYEHTIRNEFRNLVFLAGYIPQLDLATYIDHAWASLIVYAHTNSNNYFCEPNRLYQALMRGTPVITGNNPPMKRLIEETGAGVVLSSDGCQVDDIVQGIEKLKSNYQFYKNQALGVKDKFIWDNQLGRIKTLL